MSSMSLDIINNSLHYECIGGVVGNRSDEQLGRQERPIVREKREERSLRNRNQTAGRRMKI